MFPERNEKKKLVVKKHKLISQQPKAQFFRCATFSSVTKIEERKIGNSSLMKIQ